MLKNNFKYIFIFLFISLTSCQKVPLLNQVIFDYDEMPKIIVSAKLKNINNLYQSKFTEQYIDNNLINPPKDFLIKWISNNIDIKGNANQLEINILDASLKKYEVPNNTLKKYQEKTIYFFEIIFLVEYVLLDDSDQILSNVIVESKRTTTSGKLISLIELERIIDNLILQTLIDFSNESNDLIKIHFSSYIL